MQSTRIFLPFFALMLLTLIVWLYLFVRRITFLSQNKLEAHQLTPLELAKLSPPAVSTPSDNLKNLFELPTLFYALTLYLYTTQHVDNAYIVAAWIFVGFRIIHSAVHCTVNIIPVRFAVYCLSAIALWFMVLRAGLQLVLA